MPAFTAILTPEDRMIWLGRKYRRQMGCNFEPPYSSTRLLGNERGSLVLVDSGNMGRWDFRDACLMLAYTRLPCIPKAKEVARVIQLAAKA